MLPPGKGATGRAAKSWQPPGPSVHLFALFCPAQPRRSWFYPPWKGTSPQHPNTDSRVQRTAWPGKSIPACRSQPRALKRERVNMLGGQVPKQAATARGFWRGLRHGLLSLTTRPFVSPNPTLSVLVTVHAQHTKPSLVSHY